MGAFAVIGILIISFVYYISIYEILKANKSLLSLIFIPIFSRGITSLFIIKIKPISKEGFIASFKKDLNNKHCRNCREFRSVTAILFSAQRANTPQSRKVNPKELQQEHHLGNARIDRVWKSPLRWQTLEQECLHVYWRKK